MALAKSFARPLATTTATESSPLTAVVTEGSPAGMFTIDFHTPINAVNKLVKRLVINPSYSGTTLTWAVTEYNFSGSGTYVSASDPLSSTATSIVSYSLTGQDMDAVFTAGGDARS